MPPRLNKRQQRELEELEALGGASRLEHRSEDEEDTLLSRNTAFSNFLPAEEIHSESEEEGLVKPAKSQKKKKKKKASAPEPAPAATPKTPQNIAIPSGTSVPKNEKKALKKAKAREKKAGNDELEKALAELSVTYPELQKSTSPSSNSRSLAALLSVSVTHLDSEAEMRKFFGTKVIQANKSASSGSSGPSSRRHAATQRSNLTRPQSTWWPANQREGLSIRTLTSDELQSKHAKHGRHVRDSVDEKWWTVDYSQRYKSMTKSFISAVMSGHPEALWEASKKLPWHADNLLQLSEIYRHRQEYAPAFDFVDRALFAYERAFVGAFNFTSGTNRLDFDRVENRPFFLAVHRQIADLQRRGCVRTAFEFSRLLYALDPWVDPHGALFHLELLALKSGMSQWLLDLYSYFDKRREGSSGKQDVMDPGLLPGFVYARALALKIEEDTRGDTERKDSTTALKQAITAFPSIVPLLADKIDVTLPSEVRAHRDFKIETESRFLSAPQAALHLLSHMYVQCSSGLWKESDHATWFTTTVTTTFTSAPLPSAIPTTPLRTACLSLLQSDTIQSSIYRHVVVLESTHRRLFSFIPPRVLKEAKTLACDPLPPLATAVTVYNDEYFQGVEDLFAPRVRTRREREGDVRRLARMIPDAEVRRQLEAVIARPDIAAQFPGGVVEMLERMGEEGMEDLLVGMVGEADGVGVGEMPGQMPGFEVLEDGGEGVGGNHQGRVPEVEDVLPDGEGDDDDDDDQEEEEEEEEEEEHSALPRALRNILGRIWGRPVAHETSSEESDGEIGAAGEN